MQIRETTRRIIGLVEEISGLPVHVEKDTTLNCPATVTMARGNIPFHLIRFNPDKQKDPDYLICWECGFIIRLYSLDPSARKDFALNPQTLTELGKSYPVQMVSLLVQGLLLQLRSFPIGFRVSEWLHEKYSELQALQKTSIYQELNDALNALKPELKTMVPGYFYEINIAMNAAYAIFVSQLFSDPSVVLPYEKLHIFQKAKKLIQIYNDIPDNPECDNQLIDSWADLFEIRNWYVWKPYKSM